MKRTIKQNVYGNWHGYEGGRKVELFLGNTWEQEQDAREWLAGMRAVECRRDGCPVTTCTNKRRTYRGYHVMHVHGDGTPLITVGSYIEAQQFISAAADRTGGVK